MRCRLLGQMMAVTSRQKAASTSSILIWGTFGDSPVITEISVRKFKVLDMLIVSEHTIKIIQIKKFIILNVSFKKRALQIGLPRDKNRN
jgi:hypothetical protein